MQTEQKQTKGVPNSCLSLAQPQNWPTRPALIFFLAAHEASLRASRGEGKLSLPFPGRGACGSVMTLASHTATVPLHKESPGAPAAGLCHLLRPRSSPWPWCLNIAQSGCA